MFRKLSFLTILAALTLAACAPAASATPQMGYVGGGAESYPEQPMATAAPAYDEAARAASGVAGEAAVANLPTTSERLVIRNANLSLVVKDPSAAANQIAALAQSLGGFVVTSYVYQTSVDTAGNKIMQASINVRVPAEKLDEALNKIKAMAVTVNSENISGQDVTSEYTDLESHLRNLEAAEAQLQKIMDGATKTEDVLAVYNQLVYIRDQIEQVKGQMKYYRDSAALSSISADLIPDALSQPIEIGGWKPAGVAKEALEALIEALQGLADALIWGSIYLLPLALICGLPVWGGVALVRRWLKRRKAPAA